jgi:hypothetical protein
MTGSISFNVSLNLIRARVAQWVRKLDYLTTHTILSPIQRGFTPGFVNYKKGCTRLAAASDKVYQLLAHGRWFSPGTPASSTTKTGCHDIAEILLKVALNTKNQSINKSNMLSVYCSMLMDFLSLMNSEINQTERGRILPISKISKQFLAKCSS